MREKRSLMKKISKSKDSNLELINGRSVMAIMKLIDDEDTDCLETFLKDYKLNKDKVKEYIISSLDYMIHDRPESRKPTKEQIKKAKKAINETAKKAWSKK